MATISLDRARPGLRLGKAVYNDAGKLLYSAGTVLSELAIEILKKEKIEAIVLLQEADASPDTPPPGELTDAAEEVVRPRFSLMDLTDPFIAVLFDVAVRRQERLLLSKPGKPHSFSSRSTPSFHTRKPDPVKMESLVTASLKIGTLPIVFHRLVEIINNPYASANDAAKVIATDPSLSAKLLRLVNSPFYGLPSRIDTISRAVTLVGTGQLAMLAMGAILVTSFKGIPISLVSMKSFWDHSIACGIAARLLAQEAALAQQERYFVAGLLHDIARLVIYTQLPNHTLYLLTEAKRRNIPVHALERDTLGFTHEELGAEILRAWRCPAELVNKVFLHHAPLTPASTAEDATLPAGNTISHALGFGSSGELFVLPPPPDVWSLLGLSPQRLTYISLALENEVRGMRSLLSTGD